MFSVVAVEHWILIIRPQSCRDLRRTAKAGLVGVAFATIFPKLAETPQGWGDQRPERSAPRIWRACEIARRRTIVHTYRPAFAERTENF